MRYLVCFLVVGVTPALAVINGLVDGFEDGTTMNWTISAPLQLLSGGPGGVGDTYLSVDSSSSLALRNNSDRWGGNYPASHVTGIEVDIRATSVPLQVRLFVGSPPGSLAATTSSVLIPADGQWHHAEFSLAPSDLTLLSNKGGELSTLLGDVYSISFWHQPGPPALVAGPSPGVVGFDNIQAVPEPGVSLLFLWGLSLLPRSRAVSLV